MQLKSGGLRCGGSTLEPPILDLVTHSPVLKKRCRGNKWCGRTINAVDFPVALCWKHALNNQFLRQVSKSLYHQNTQLQKQNLWHKKNKVLTESTMIWPHDQWGRFPLSTLLKTWLTKKTVVETHLKILIPPRIHNSWS